MSIVIDPMEPVAPPRKKTAKPLELVVTETLDEKSKPLTSAVLQNENTVEELAVSIGADYSGSREMRFDRVAFHINQSMHNILSAGINLMMLKEECEHGEFASALHERGISDRTAQAAMQQVRFVLSVPESDRNRLLELPKSHVLALASADPEVLEDLLQDDEIDLQALSVRELRNTIKDLSARKTDMATQLEAADLEIERLQGIIRELRENRVKTSGNVPIEVQDIRLEIAALFKKAEMSIQDMDKNAIGFLDTGDLADWHAPVLRNLYGAVQALHFHTGSILLDLKNSSFELHGDASALDIFSPEEVLRCGREYRELIGEHKHEKSVREWEREMERPRGKGRPKNKPGVE